MEETEQSDQASIADALRIVLDAEKEARTRLSECEGEAKRFSDAALARAQLIRRRGEQRIHRLRAHHSDLAESRRADLQSQIGALTTSANLDDNETRSLDFAVEQLADELLGVDE